MTSEDKRYGFRFIAKGPNEEKSKKWFENQSNKNLSLELIIQNTIKTYGYQDLSDVITQNFINDANIAMNNESPSSKDQTIQQLKEIIKKLEPITDKQINPELKKIMKNQDAQPLFGKPKSESTSESTPSTNKPKNPKVNAKNFFG